MSVNCLPSASCRVTFVEYYSTFLCTAAALHAGRDCSPQAEGTPEQSQAQGFTESTTLMRVPAQLSAMHLFNREHHNIHELLQWAIQASLTCMSQRNDRPSVAGLLQLPGARHDVAA